MNHSTTNVVTRLIRSSRQVRLGEHETIVGVPIKERAIVCLLVLASIVGCTPPKPDPSNVPQSAAIPAPPANTVADAKPPPSVAQPPADPIEKVSPRIEQPTADENTPARNARRAAIARQPNAKSAASAQSAATLTNPVNTPIAAPPSGTQSTQQSAATIDLAALEQRLRNTRAIGVMTKLSLKNQVDDLLDDFQSFYQGKLRIPLAELRQRYDLLMMKVLTLLQDSDSALAASIVASREAIWEVLNDPVRLSRSRSG